MCDNANEQTHNFYYGHILTIVFTTSIKYKIFNLCSFTVQWFNLETRPKVY